MQLYSRRLCQALLTMLAGMIFIGCLFSGFLYAKSRIYDDLLSVTFPNEKEGWACGRWGTAIHTKDGGHTWERQNTGVEYGLFSIHFVDSRHGWAVGDEGTIIHTADGGKSWSRQKAPTYSGRKIRVTKDGGKTWKMAESKEHYTLMDVFFVTPTTGWIVGEETHIFYTENGGKTWSLQFKDEDYILKAVSFSSPLIGWAVGEYGFTYHTADGGKTWEHQAGFCRVSDETDEIEGGAFLFDITAIDERTAWAVGIDGYVTKTEDGGKTWVKIKTGVRETQLFGIAMDKKNTIVIGGKGVFIVSTDNGRTWYEPEFRPPITYGWIYGIDYIFPSGFITVGYKGSIYLSNGKNVERPWINVSSKVDNLRNHLER
jgi:photosystem II stability/assembly factor-like uncharacterized protein